MPNNKSRSKNSAKAGNKTQGKRITLLQVATDSLNDVGQVLKGSFVLSGNLQEGKAGISAFNGVVKGLHEERMCKEFEKKYEESAFFE